MFDTVRDLLEYLFEKRGKRRGIVSVQSTDLAQHAAMVMAEEKINLVAVKNGTSFVGVISSSDTSGEFGGSSARPSERMASEIMTTEVVAIDVDEKLMGLPDKLNKIRHVIVTENGRWIAVLDSNEVLDGVMRSYEERDSHEAQVRGEFRRQD